MEKKMHQLNFKIPEELWVKIDMLAKEEDRSVTKMITVILQKYIKEREKGGESSSFFF